MALLPFPCLAGWWAGRYPATGPVPRLPAPRSGPESARRPRATPGTPELLCRILLRASLGLGVLALGPAGARDECRGMVGSHGGISELLSCGQDTFSERLT